MIKPTFYEQVLEVSEGYCQRWMTAPHIVDALSFSQVCDSVSDALFLEERREEREKATVKIYKDDKSGQTRITLPCMPKE